MSVLNAIFLDFVIEPVLFPLQSVLQNCFNVVVRFDAVLEVLCASS